MGINKKELLEPLEKREQLKLVLRCNNEAFIEFGRWPRDFDYYVLNIVLAKLFSKIFC